MYMYSINLTARMKKDTTYGRQKVIYFIDENGSQDKIKTMKIIIYDF